jgi:hypothetical protein
MDGRKFLGFPPRRELHSIQRPKPIQRAKPIQKPKRATLKGGATLKQVQRPAAVVTTLIPYPLPPVLSISVKTKELGRSVLASVSKQRTYKSLVLILIHALLKRTGFWSGRWDEANMGNSWFYSNGWGDGSSKSAVQGSAGGGC